MPAKIFIAGICGTFMAGIAQLARAAGMEVRGCDANVYPPMSDLLRAQNINIAEGYLPSHLSADADADDGTKQTILIGNALSRGNPLVEHVLNARLAFTSGAQWLRENVLTGRRVIAVAGTHGKTSTASMLAWMLHCAGAKPGFLIGGQPGNFAASAAPGEGDNFVIEADEYDTAFFDKRAKFVHYEPSIALLNNLEFDHADIYDDIAQIQKQFHYFVRLVPGNGRVIANADDARVGEVLAMGCWSRVLEFSLCNREADWFAAADDASEFIVYRRGDEVARVKWNCIGRHNMQNALAAIAAADAVGVAAADAAEALQTYQPAARRLQLLFAGDSLRLYDDFAHHPTAIQRTIEAVRARHGGRVIAVVELRSNTMKEGAHGGALAVALQTADCALVCGGEAAAAGVNTLPVDEIIPEVLRLQSDENTSIVTMSNGDFAGLPARLCAQLQSKRP